MKCYLFWLWYFIFSLIREWGRGGSQVGGCHRWFFLHSLWFFSPIMVCESSVLLGTCMAFQVKMKLEAIPQCINQCDWGLKMHEKNGSLVGGECSVSLSKGVSRKPLQFSSLVAMHKTSVKRPGPSVLLFTTSLFFHNPKLLFMFSAKSCIYE